MKALIWRDPYDSNYFGVGVRVSKTQFHPAGIAKWFELSIDAVGDCFGSEQVKKLKTVGNEPVEIELEMKFVEAG